MGKVHLIDACPTAHETRAIYMCRSLDGKAYMKFEIGQALPGPTEIYITENPVVFRSMMTRFCPVGTTIRVMRNGITHSYEYGV